MSTSTRRPVIDSSTLEAICRTIADTADGLTGSEIGRLLSELQIVDCDPMITKWKRLFNALAANQNQLQYSNNIIKFVQNAMRPVRYTNKEEVFQARRQELNKSLSFLGICLQESGKYMVVEKSKTIAEAEERASRFREKLNLRNVHPKIFEYCQPELLRDNYFHSVFEGVKSVADRLREITGLHADGNPLVDTAFSTTNPLIRINLLQNDTHRSEHLGLMNLCKSLFGLIRNPTAHQPQIKFPIHQEEALDLMILISYCHKRLDKAI